MTPTGVQSPQEIPGRISSNPGECSRSIARGPLAIELPNFVFAVEFFREGGLNLARCTD